MTCDSIEPELVGYHFGLLDREARDRVETHLAECPACVRSFMLIKRAIELDDESEVPLPSPSARARLRRAAAAELGLAPVVRAWWERPVAFAVAASVLLGAGVATKKMTSGPGAPPYGWSVEAHTNDSSR